MRRALRQLCQEIDGARLNEDARDVVISSITDDSRAVEPGALFIAVPGAKVDGRHHAAAAVAAGAAAVLAQDEVAVDAPVVLVPDARAALAQIAADWFGHPARRLRMVGITGTVGKTTVLSMIGHILDSAGIATGTIGSLGIHFPGHTDSTPNTTPGALKLQRTFAAMADAGTDVAMMEVTSHALAQQRVGGVSYDVGIFTNLVMLEHMEYHGTFRGYANVKARFLDMLTSGAPLIHAAGDRTVRQLARRHAGPRISCGGGGARVAVRRDRMGLDGTGLTLTVRRPLPLAGGGCIEPVSFPIELRALGRPNISNASLAAATALTLGVQPELVRSALAAFEPPRRRMQVIRRAGPVIIDDTVGHPDSISAVMEIADRIPHDALRMVFVVRGQRGPEINARDAEALAIWARRVRVHSLAVTSAIDTADDRNTVTADEHAAFTGELERKGVRFTVHERLDDAIDQTLRLAGRRDLVLLLGAQGMDAGASIIASILD